MKEVLNVTRSYPVFTPGRFDWLSWGLAGKVFFFGCVNIALVFGYMHYVKLTIGDP